MKEELVRISIDDFRKNRNSILETSFSKTEKKTIDNLNTQSIAARYALKQAIKNLYPQIDFSLKGIVIANNIDGAPCIKTLPDEILKDIPEDTGKIRISISHSKKYAAGFAVLFRETYE